MDAAPMLPPSFDSSFGDAPFPPRTSAAAPAASLGGDLGPVAADFSAQLLGSYQWCEVTGDLLLLGLPPPAVQAAWRVLLLAAARVDALGLASGGPRGQRAVFPEASGW